MIRMMKPIRFPAPKAQLRLRPAQPESAPAKQDKEISLASILQKTDPTTRASSSFTKTIEAAESPSESVSAADAKLMELAQLQRDLTTQRAELAERERAHRETEMLLSARQRLLDQRQAVIAATVSSNPAALRALESQLNEFREALEAAQRDLAAKDAEVQALQTAAIGEEPLAGITSLDQITAPELSEQVAFLREREAFIEASENTLFEKAQSLQEWETRLEQAAHDQDFEARQ